MLLSQDLTEGWRKIAITLIACPWVKNTRHTKHIREVFRVYRLIPRNVSYTFKTM